MICSNCGMINNEENKFCLFCGNPLKNNQNINPVNNTNTESLNINPVNNINNEPLNMNSVNNINNEQLNMNPVNNINNESLNINPVNNINNESLNINPVNNINTESLNMNPVNNINTESLNINPVNNINTEPLNMNPVNNMGNQFTKKSKLNKSILIISFVAIFAIIAVITCIFVFKNISPKVYDTGQAVTLVDGSKWHVIGYNEDGQIILLLDQLVKDKVGYGLTGSKEYQEYENSYLKQYIENEYLPELEISLLKNGGNIENLKARLLKVDEYLELTKETLGKTTYLWSSFSYEHFEEYCLANEWLGLTDSYWTMNNIREYTDDTKVFGGYAVLVSDAGQCSRYGIDVGSVSLNVDNYARFEDPNLIENIGLGSYYGIRPVIEVDPSNIK